MASNTKSQTKPSSEEAVKKAVKETPGSTTGSIAQAAGIGRSTAGKALGRLADKGELTRHKGGRDGQKLLPDRWTLTGAEMPPAPAGSMTSGSSTKPNSTKQSGTAKATKASKAKPSSSSSDDNPAAAKTNADRRLKAGGLEPLVLGYLKKNADSGPHGPAAVANALERSSGAVNNCLIRLTKAKKVRQVSDKPRRYSLAA